MKVCAHNLAWNAVISASEKTLLIETREVYLLLNQAFKRTE